MSREYCAEVDLRGKKRKHDGAKTRRRASLACDICRKQKEKCEGGPPCWRCQRLGRPCRFQEPSMAKKPDITILRDAPSPILGKDSQRIQNLEHVVRYFLSDVPLDEENLSRIAAKCTMKNDEIESALDVNETFDVQFVSKNVALFWRVLALEFLGEIATDYAASPITEFLVGVFFKYEEVNSFYLEKGWIHDKIQYCYDPASEYTTSDIPWVCTFFAVLAIGTQMAHMEDDCSGPDSKDSDEFNVCSEDSVGLEFYHVASKLVPDVILAASYESVQAFLLLAAWALPVSTGGLSYTYFGLSMKMAIQNGMHRKYIGGDCDQRILEMRNRLFWTVYTLEKRTSILHGRPSSLARSEINADLPTDCASFESPNFKNMMAFIKLVSWMSKVAETLSQFKKCPRGLLLEHLERLLKLKDDIGEWWNSLPERIECRDYTPCGPLFRQNLHMKLCYLLVYIYMGRPFIFGREQSSRESLHKGKNHRERLVDDCVQSALEILATLQSLADNFRLCRASYTEFSSCRAALLVILAESLNSGRSLKLQNGLKCGMALIRQMIGGTSSESEISYIESFESAIRQFSSNEGDNDVLTTTPELNSSSAYAKFKDWTQSMKKDKGISSNLDLASFSPISLFASGAETSSLSKFSDLTDLLNPNWVPNELELDLDALLAHR
ncbi:hypothetical protein N7462_011076 [Penicillium macrosclerotiorum]|uniref:uncharacterized protein n=1 Tax=Penicillium macrosclerotiorum TaxID=303699 RepID=UPI002549083A|nr:uncharacterized protein N7462_011076 [Penicillium macrosclerotiorum]KAJ5666667.1 hypothetical protein N7462_011076 [Penicillium macrosclerotiorum]